MPRLHAVEHLGRVDDVEYRSRNSAGQRIAAEGRAVDADRERARDLGGCQHRPDGKPAAQSLGAGQNVRNHTLLHVRKERASAAHTALDLVEDEQRVVFVAEPSRRGQEFRRARNHSPFALHRLEYHRADVVAAFFRERRFDSMLRIADRVRADTTCPFRQQQTTVRRPAFSAVW